MQWRWRWWRRRYCHFLAGTSPFLNHQFYNQSAASFKWRSQCLRPVRQYTASVLKTEFLLRLSEKVILSKKLFQTYFKDRLPHIFDLPVIIETIISRPAVNSSILNLIPLSIIVSAGLCSQNEAIENPPTAQTQGSRFDSLMVYIRPSEQLPFSYLKQKYKFKRSSDFSFQIAKDHQSRSTL